jgi:GNAT superfamily N-acetyltransferase
VPGVRPAGEADLEPMLDLAEARRRQYAGLHGRFHRPAPGAREVQRGFFRHLLAASDCIVLVAEHEGGAVAGFVIGRLFPPPPVYDPGGPACMVDDFAVADPALWPGLGRALLDAVRERAHERGAVQMVVVCAPEDGPKQALLAGSGLDVVTEWWRRDL